MSLAHYFFLTHANVLHHWKENEILHWYKYVVTLQCQQYRYSMVANMANEKERLHHSRIPDSEAPPDFVLPDNVDSALLSNIVYREGFS